MFAIERFDFNAEAGGGNDNASSSKASKLASYLARVQSRKAIQSSPAADLRYSPSTKESPSSKKAKKRKRQSEDAPGDEVEEEGSEPSTEEKTKTRKRDRKEEGKQHANGHAEAPVEADDIDRQEKRAKKERKKKHKEKEEEEKEVQEEEAAVSAADPAQEKRRKEDKKKKKKGDKAAQREEEKGEGRSTILTTISQESSSSPKDEEKREEPPRSSGLERIRLMLSGHMKKPRLPPPRPPAAAANASKLQISSASSNGGSSGKKKGMTTITTTTTVYSKIATGDGTSAEEEDEKEEEEVGAHLKGSKAKEGMVGREQKEKQEEEEGEGEEKGEDDEALTAAEAAKRWGLDERLVRTLHAQGIERFFKVQCRVLPYLVSTAQGELIRDAVVCAPTGSGKTLVYVLALLQGLRDRRIVRLRGLVVVPNRDLAIQVVTEFNRFAPAVGIKVGLSIGQTDFQKEQIDLCGLSNPTASSRSKGRRGRGKERVGGGGGEGGHSLVDILVATPGRLMDHMEKTPGFTLQHLKYLVIDEGKEPWLYLQHLKYLVIDEVDRLVNQSYQDWAHQVYEAAYGQVRGTFHLNTSPDQPAHEIRPTTVRIRPQTTKEHVILPLLPPPPLRKLLFSATFTSNPQKLAMLDLRNARYFSVTGVMTEDYFHADEEDEKEGGMGGRYSTPETLTEESITCEARQKPLILLALLRGELKTAGLVLIFTSSVDSTHRLCRLLQLAAAGSSTSSSNSSAEKKKEERRGKEPDRGKEEEGGKEEKEEGDAAGNIKEFSSALTQPQRADLIHRCLNGQVRVVVSSDGMARGIDLPNVAVVINYDVPTQAKTYVHRVGRTARAGKSGRSLTILKRGQEVYFQRMRASVDGKRVDRYPLKQVGDVEPLMPEYRLALAALKDVLIRERQGRLRITEPLAVSDVAAMIKEQQQHQRRKKGEEKEGGVLEEEVDAMEIEDEEEEEGSDNE